MIWRAFPGPAAVFLFGLIAVAAPLLGYPATHRAEEVLSEGPNVWWWVVPAVGIFAASARRGRAGLLAGAAGAALVWGFYRWVVPMGEPSDPAVVSGVLVLLLGALLAAGRGRLDRRPVRPVRRYVLGGVLALLGASLATATVRQGAEYGMTAHPAESSTIPTTAALRAGRQAAVYGVSSSETRPECRITGPDGSTRTARTIPIQPATPGYDATPGYRWVASFETTAAGSYSMTCQGGSAGASYTFGGRPEIDGTVAALVHWPRPALWLLGALPGLFLIAAAANHQRRQIASAREVATMRVASSSGGSGLAK